VGYLEDALGRCIQRVEKRTGVWKPLFRIESQCTTDDRLQRRRYGAVAVADRGNRLRIAIS
jgi:hypothetical protein